MGHSHARSPLQDVNGRFVHDAKDKSKVTLKAGHGTSHDPHASYPRTPDLESDSDWEETTAAPGAHSAASNHINIVLPGDESILTGLDRTGPRVRFRSRVRISAGIGRRRRFSDGRSSSASSLSGSPSSSISAPLRTHYTGNNGWGTLGSRINVAAPQAAPIPPCLGSDGGKGNVGWNGDGGGGGNARRRCARSSWTCHLDDDADEHTHLLTSAARHSYVGAYVHDGYHDNGERERERWLREQLVEEAFGKWPARLLNRHWWWWHLEPILCCFCEPDEEE